MVTYPIVFDGKSCGTLRESREGLFSVFRADCAMRDSLTRLWVYGDGQRVSLGVLEPNNGRLVLTRRLSRAERQRLPRSIAFAGGPNETPPDVPTEKAPEQRAGSGLTWYAHRDGSLTAAAGQRRYLALPVAMKASPSLSPRIRRIGGRDYLVFRF